MSSTLLPEFFTLLSIDLFVLLSLLTCLMEDKFPKAVPYIYQIAALAGFGHILVSKEFLYIFDVYMRFWYSVLYLAIALANVVAINIYFVFSKKQWLLAKAWSACVTFPTVVISAFFVYNYGLLEETIYPAFMMQLVAGISVAILLAGVGIFLSPNLINKLRKR